jgi:hypothetical protein
VQSIVSSIWQLQQQFPPSGIAAPYHEIDGGQVVVWLTYHWPPMKAQTTSSPDFTLALAARQYGLAL